MINGGDTNMGYGIVRCKPITIKPDEEIELGPLHIPFEHRAVIHGTVLCPDNKPAKGAVVKLLKVKSHDGFDCEAENIRTCDLEPVGHQFTDDCGQFLFPIEDTTARYVVKATIFKPQSRRVECDC
jgi:hypothetical protein